MKVDSSEKFSSARLRPHGVFRSAGLQCARRPERDRPPEPTLDRAALEAYAGTYTSAEFDATYRVIAGDSTLTLRTGETPGLVARGVFPDGFVSGQITIQFVREGGRVTGFEISHPRARGEAFVRAAQMR